MANNKKSTNTENFREMMKRSSSWLRGGSVPPPDSDPVVPQAVARNLRGKSRGRGGRTAASPGRSDAQVDRPADTTPVVTLTAPKDTNDALAPPAPDLDITSSEVNGNKRSGTSVLHSGGLISRDEVNNEPHSRSPTRRNTTSAIGKSPPRGFHSWLKANGLTVVNDSGVSTSATQNVSSALAHKEKASAPTHATSKTPTQAIVDKSTTVVQKEKTWVDLTKDDVVKKKKVEVGEAGIQTSGLVGLSKYFEDKMEAMKGYVPLSIFNVMWLKQALIHQSNGVTTKKNKDESRYNGLPVPDEWRMTFGEWVTAFDLFVAYLRYYGHGTTADKFVIHKQNVFAIRAERMSWPMAFRYNQAVRTSVMTFRNPDGKLANPAIRDETIERDARLETERLGDFQPRFADENPYAEGRSKAHIHPITGEVNFQTGQNAWNHGSNHVSTSSLHHGGHSGKPNARSWSYANQPAYDGPGSSGFHHQDERRGGGRNVRGRNRGGGWSGYGYAGQDQGPSNRRGNDYFDSRRGDRAGSWNREDRGNDRRGGDRDGNAAKYSRGGKAK